MVRNSESILILKIRNILYRIIAVLIQSYGLIVIINNSNIDNLYMTPVFNVKQDLSELRSSLYSTFCLKPVVDYSNGPNVR